MTEAEEMELLKQTIYEASSSALFAIAKVVMEKYRHQEGDVGGDAMLATIAAARELERTLYLTATQARPELNWDLIDTQLEAYVQGGLDRYRESRG